jgi:anti-sigma regulatory factor (Ser/Thr protein kinase)
VTIAASFPYDATAIPAARRFVRTALSRWPQEQIEAAELMVSELATNCYQHACTGFRIALRDGGEIMRIEVTDSGGGMPRPLSPLPTDPSGRGLRIVEALADQWGVTRERGGKTVWFELPAPS